jgi:hypothetical protein
MQRTGIRLSVGDPLEVNMGLPLGQTTESVIVTGSAELVESGTAALGKALPTRAIQELP